MNYLEVVGPAFLGNTPMIVAWLVGIVIAVLMLRRGVEKQRSYFWPVVA